MGLQGYGILAGGDNNGLGSCQLTDAEIENRYREKCGSLEAGRYMEYVLSTMDLISDLVI